MPSPVVVVAVVLRCRCLPRRRSTVCVFAQDRARDFDASRGGSHPAADLVVADDWRAHLVCAKGKGRRLGKRTNAAAHFGVAVSDWTVSYPPPPPMSRGRFSTLTYFLSPLRVLYFLL